MFKYNALNWDKWDPAPLTPNKIRIVPLGGLGEVGRNMSVVEIIDPYHLDEDPKLLLIDCGVLFPGEDQPGVDLILPDFSYISERLDRVDALVLTHGHEDHIGAVPYLLKLRSDIKVIGSRLTIALVEKKCEEHRIRPNVTIVKEGDSYQAGPFNLEFLPVNHSIPDALAVFIKTEYGNVLNTGDFKMDQIPLDGRLTDLRLFSQAGEEGVGVFMVDSTNAQIDGFVMSEQEIKPALNALFSKHQANNQNNKIIVSTFASHFHRLSHIFDIALAYNKKVCLMGRTMRNNMAIAQNLKIINIPDGILVDEKHVESIPPSQLVILATGSQGESLAALSRMARGDHAKINIVPDDMVIMASSTIPGNEKGIFALINQLQTIGAKVYTSADAKIHCSGHACKNELRYIYNVVNPQNVLPIHGEPRHLLANADVANSVGIQKDHIAIIQNGTVLDYCDGDIDVVGRLDHGYVYVDGKAIDVVTDEDLEHRKILSQEGFVSVTVIYNPKTLKVINRPKIVAKGVAEDPIVYRNLPERVLSAVEKELNKPSWTPKSVTKAARRSVGSWVAMKLRRSPMILPIVIEGKDEENYE